MESRYIKKITGEKVYLSPISTDNTEEYTHMVNDIKVALGLGNITYTEIMDYERENDFLHSIKDKKQFAARLMENDELLGNLGFNSIDMINRSGVIGIMLGNPEQQGKGYGKEAINLLLDYGFSLLNLNNISLNVFEYNEVAYNLYRKIGFKEVGRLRKRVEVMGKKYDDIIMDMLKEEFTSYYIKREVEKRYKL